MWSYSRFCLLLFFILFLGPLTTACTGCSKPTECVEDVSSQENDTNNLDCESRCDCNNQKYEGYCVNGKCESAARGTCKFQGSKTACKLPKSLRKDATKDCEEWGERECQPSPLKSQLEGDCKTYEADKELLKRCTNNRDDDCNGLIDDDAEGCQDICPREGIQRPCYPKDQKETLNVGSCKAGLQTCGAGNKWGTCEGVVTPQTEVCNGKDDNCDGNIDEDINGCATTSVCKNGETMPCYTELVGCVRGFGNAFTCQGICKTGLRDCQGGKWSICKNPGLPAQEKCNGTDDNCDGNIDETCPCNDGDSRECYRVEEKKRGVGECKEGKQLCYNGQWSECIGAGKATPELCDFKDNNCDGVIDEGCGKGKDESCTLGYSRPCYTDLPKTLNVGPCRSGLQECQLDPTDNTYKLGPCVQEVKPTKEVCDGVDNDCNGQVDEGCAEGTTKECGPGFLQTCYTGDPKNQGVGTCRSGFRVCEKDQKDNTYKLGPCVGDIKPTTEVCDGLDNDCDGQIDNDCKGCTVGAKKPCYTGPAGTEKNLPCKPGEQVCEKAPDGSPENLWGPCTNDVVPQPEIPNNQIDEDCDGKVDNTTISPEVCDGKDNDQKNGIDDGVCILAMACTKYDDNDENTYACRFKCTTPSRFAQSNECRAQSSSDVYCIPRQKGDKTIENVCLPSIPEFCDGVDNNKNNQIDENTCPTGQTCVETRPGDSNSYQCLPKCTTSNPNAPSAECTNHMGKYCLPLQKGDKTNENVCVSKTPEVCDGQDNDVDGKVDEGTCSSGMACVESKLGVPTSYKCLPTCTTPDETVPSPECMSGQYCLSLPTGDGSGANVCMEI